MILTRLVVAVVVFVCAAAAPAGAASNYTLFESGQVRPLALSPDGLRLFALNTPDNRLEIFDVNGGNPTHVGSVPVGLEPVAVAVRTDTEVWVVNHLSDSVSIVDVTDPAAPRVTRTLLTGDEPRDIVFGGPRVPPVTGPFTWAFITTAHRGQNTSLATAKCAGGTNNGAVCTSVSACPGGGACTRADLAKPGVGRANVWVFDAGNLGATLGGTAKTVITLFGDTPRALAVTPDGQSVYAAVFHSGNRTTALSEGVVCDGGAGAAACGPRVCVAGPNGHAPCTQNSECPSSSCSVGVRSSGGLPAPNTDHNLLQQPEVGLIVKYDGVHWSDELGRNWDLAVNFWLPDKDVFKIDATQDPPIETSFSTGVGTVLFNMVVNPASGKLYVANTDAQNDVRFEGTGDFVTDNSFKPPGEPASVRGHLVESRITVIDGATVTPRHLNKHIVYSTCCAATPNTENDASLAFPLGMAVSSDGATLYVAGFGSSKIGVYETTGTNGLENDQFTPGAFDMPVTGLGACPGGSCGPTGLALDETNSRLYVLTRFDNGLSVFSTGTGMEAAHLPLHNPEPASIVDGRRFNYDAKFTSSHGDSACASCHIFADFDSLAWDLGDPDGNLLTNPGPFKVGPIGSPPANYVDFHPLKGPMTTQSLRGMANHGAMHWRGDRTGGNDESSAQPDDGTFDEDAAFKKFNGAFPGLLGRSATLELNEMQAYTDFILRVTYPPNPIRNLDNSLTFDEQVGANFFNGPISDTLQKCEGCHRLLPTANDSFGVAAPGFFGTDGQQSFEGETQHLKIPHLRNMYQKVGMFGMGGVPFFNGGNNGFTGDQVRGFGFLHDGSVDTLFRFHSATVFNQSGFNPNGIPAGTAGDPLRRQIEAFMMAFDSNLAPIVGQQITRTSTNGAVVDPRIDLLVARANAGECDLVAKGEVGGEARGWLYVDGQFQSDRVAETPLSDGALRALANTGGQELTFTCVPPGSGIRIGIDRDADACADGDEVDAGSDPADPGSVPVTCAAPCGSVTPFVFQRATLKDSKGRLSISVKDVPLGIYAQEAVSAVALDGGGTIFAGTQPGATIVPKGRGFRFVAPAGSTGIVRVTVRESGTTPGLFRVTLKTRGAWTPPAADETELTTEVTLNVGGICLRGAATRVNL